MTKAGKPPQYTKVDFKKWHQLAQSGVEPIHIAERVGASYKFVQRKIKEAERGEI